MMITLIAMSLLSAPTVVEADQITRRLNGQMIQVEDVISSVLGSGDARQFRMKRAGNTVFRVGERGPAELRGNAVVVGMVQADGGQIVVDVKSVSLLPSDNDQYETRANKIKEGDFAAWYDLAEWARRRFRMYDDPKMKERSQQAYRRGLKVERDSAAGNVEKIKSLRTRLEEQDFLPTPDYLDIDHELLWVDFGVIAPTKAADLESFAVRVAKDLRNNATVPAPVSKEDAEAYQRDPIRYFGNQPEAKRQSLARYWEVTLRRHALVEKVKSGELNEYTAADEAAAQLREYPEIEKEWLERAVEKDEKHLAELRRRDVEWMTDKLRDRMKDSSRADKIRRSWLKMVEDGIRQKEKAADEEAKKNGKSKSVHDARARLDLAIIMLEWYPQDAALRSHAAQLLIESLQIEPTYEQAIDKLKELGYFKQASGKWLDPEQAAKVEVNEEKPRFAEVGMNEEAVRKVLGTPDSQARLITGPRLVTLQWAYRGMEQGVFVEFQRDRDEAWRVSAVHKTEVKKLDDAK